MHINCKVLHLHRHLINESCLSSLHEAVWAGGLWAPFILELSARWKVIMSFTRRPIYPHNWKAPDTVYIRIYIYIKYKYKWENRNLFYACRQFWVAQHVARSLCHLSYTGSFNHLLYSATVLLNLDLHSANKISR